MPVFTGLKGFTAGRFYVDFELKRKPRILIGKRFPYSYWPLRSAFEIIFHLFPCVSEVTGSLVEKVRHPPNPSRGNGRSARCTRFAINPRKLASPLLD